MRGDLTVQEHGTKAIVSYNTRFGLAFLADTIGRAGTVYKGEALYLERKDAFELTVEAQHAGLKVSIR